MENNKKFGFFDRFRPPKKEITEEEDRTPTLKFFFKLLWRKARGLVTLNFMMLFLIIPIVAGVLLYILSPNTPSATSPLYAPIYGASMISESPAIASVLNAVNFQIGLPVLSTGRSFALIGLGLFLLLTWGLQNVGAAYVLRGFFRGDAVFVFSDYFYGIRKNWKQALGLGTLDLIVLALLGIDYYALYRGTSAGLNDVMLGVIFAIAVIYFFMRFYIYQLMITFEMKWTKILKNSLIFSILGIKRNILAALGIAVLVVLNLLLLLLFLPYTTIPLFLPCFYLFSFTAFMSVYAAYPIIDRYLIKPYEAAHPTITEENSEESEENDDAAASDSSV